MSDRMSYAVGGFREVQADFGAADDSSASVDTLAALLNITKSDLAVASGLPREAISKVTRLAAPNTQARLRDLMEILTRTQVWAGSIGQAFAWYRSQPLPSFGDQTAEDLVKEGRAEAVKAYLSRIAVGGYA